MAHMKVLHYVGVFSEPSETFIYDLVTSLESNNVENYVLSHKRLLEIERPFERVKVIKENINIFKKIYHRLFHRWSIATEKALMFINELQPDVIHAHFGPNGLKIFDLIHFKLNFKIVYHFMAWI